MIARLLPVLPLLLLASCRTAPDPGADRDAARGRALVECFSDAPPNAPNRPVSECMAEKGFPPQRPR